MGFMNSNNTVIFQSFTDAARVATKIGGKVVNMGNNKYGVFSEK